MRPPGELTDRVDRVIAALGEGWCGRITANPAVREAHSHGEGFRAARAPDAVAFARTTADVVALVEQCALQDVPLIPFGVGTSLEGHVHALHGGICLDLGGMDRIIDVNPADMDCRIEAGVTREALNLHLRDQGLFFPLDPGANATLGGMAATRASGTNAVRYGTMRDVTLGLTVVTPQGQVITTGGRARKSSAGYDLTRLYIGSEGTLGIITEIQLRLFGIPDTIAAAVCQFDSLESAVNAVIHVLQIGVPVARIELLDAVQMDACIRYSNLQGFDPKPSLFFEFHGFARTVAEQVEHVTAVVQEYDGSALQHADSPEDRAQLWSARHNAFWAGRALKPGCESFATDACVPISRLTQAITEAKQQADSLGLIAPIVGHVGDGNFHLLVLFDPSDSDERGRAEELIGKVADIALSVGGTITGEHGIGAHKIDLLHREHGPATETMQRIKCALDPAGLMNPGKIHRDV
ncbi:FAD-binding oxidoreductase [Blastomonas fulva]|uniref:FAD-binding oxidoreductase n=1 Tax=Blastomonas fulva TaxID=1550728 RepID=UPI003D27E991